jgi:hypothetical protein
MQEGVAVLVRAVDVAASIKELGDNGGVPALAGNVERRIAQVIPAMQQKLVKGQELVKGQDRVETFLLPVPRSPVEGRHGGTLGCLHRSRGLLGGSTKHGRRA